MTNKDFQLILQRYPDEMPVKIVLDSTDPFSLVNDFTEDDILHTSETAHVVEAEDDGDDEIKLGDGQQYLLINPIIY